MPSKALLGHWVSDYGDSYYGAGSRIWIGKDGSRYEIEYKVVEEDPQNMTLIIAMKGQGDSEFKEQTAFQFREDATIASLWAGEIASRYSPEMRMRYVDDAQDPVASPPAAGK